MILCVAEKPSVGRDIAKVLGATRPHDGFMEGNGYCVTWTFGHLCALYEPNDYQDLWKRWDLSLLPMIPERFSIKVSKDQGIVKQFNIIKDLISRADELINCGDAGQEGELIQRWVYQKAGCRIPVKRLWISSLTEDAIREGFKNLKDQSEYERLYEAGLMRAIGDWLLGMNATRAYTIRYPHQDNGRTQVLSIGRVQTPTLALIVKRHHEIQRFRSVTYWELKTRYRDTEFSLMAEEEDRKMTNKEEAERLVESITSQPFRIKSVEKKRATEYAPRLFDLTSLQVECNRLFSFSADDTLKLIQSLYEKHITTYPRVDTQFLSDDIYPKVPQIFKGIEQSFPQITRLRELMREEQQRTGKPQKIKKSKRVFDSKKVTDHHAIIPTGQQPNNLTPDERLVFDLVAKRFIAAFYPDCVVNNTTVIGEVMPKDDSLVGGVSEGQDKQPLLFRTTGRQIVTPGWREVLDKEKGTQKDTPKSSTPDDTDKNVQSEEDKPDSQERVLPEFKKGEEGEHQPYLQERQTTPPKPYTEATLLRAMETAGKTVDNEELRDALKENGIGRPSTRAAIIEKLFQRKYIKKERKSLSPTPLGIELIRTIHTPLLKSAELTGLWEKKLREIERGEYETRQFLDELKQMTAEVVSEVLRDRSGMRCPVCGQGVIIRGNSRYGCSRWREGCSFSAPFDE